MICPEELAAMVTATAVALSQGKSDVELAVLATVLTQLGDTISTIAAQRAHIQFCIEQNKQKQSKENSSPQEVSD